METFKKKIQMHSIAKLKNTPTKASIVLNIKMSSIFKCLDTSLTYAYKTKFTIKQYTLPCPIK